MLLASTATSLAATGLREVQETRHALGSKIAIKVLHPNHRQAKESIQSAFAEIERVESLMSIYRPTSQLSTLNREGSLANPASDLVKLLEQAAAISRHSKGAFDVTVQPLWRLFRSMPGPQSLPDAAAIAAAKKRVNWRNVAISPDRIQLKRPDAQITLNGIAQGYAADRARTILKESGMQHALIDCGEIGSLGQNEDGKAWKIGIQHPRKPQSFAAMVPLTNRSLATSGDYETYFSDDLKQHHIFDPRTGISPTEIASATVAAPNATLADALSTTLVVMGIEKGFRFLSQFPRVDAMVITKDGRQLHSPRFPQSP